MRARMEIPVHLPAWPLAAGVRHNLFLAYKEGLNNVVKHAGAAHPVPDILYSRPAHLLRTWWYQSNKQ
jgi:glucose-6-phosphate-specific signal transduction histidine kinase